MRERLINIKQAIHLLKEANAPTCRDVFDTRGEGNASKLKKMLTWNQPASLRSREAWNKEQAYHALEAQMQSLKYDSSFPSLGPPTPLTPQRRRGTRHQYDPATATVLPQDVLHAEKPDGPPPPLSLASVQRIV